VELCVLWHLLGAQPQRLQLPPLLEARPMVLHMPLNNTTAGTLSVTEE
jgi:hypothetical protein